jgi:hypothetical protein
MSSTDRDSTRLRLTRLAVLGGGLVLVVAGGLVLRQHGPGNMGNGFIGGGVLAVLLAGLAVWHSTTRPASASTFERAFTQNGDERDDAVLTRALAVLGLCAVPVTGIAAVSIGLGADESMVLALLLIAQLTIGAVAFVVINRRG